MATFKEVRDGTADDLKAIAGYLTQAAQAVSDGDTGAVAYILDKWGSWGQMLMIRHDNRMSEYREAQDGDGPFQIFPDSDALNPEPPK
jgi:hypothetical protein